MCNAVDSRYLHGLGLVSPRPSLLPPRRLSLQRKFRPFRLEFLSRTDKTFSATAPAVTSALRDMEVAFSPSRFPLEAWMISSPPTRSRVTRTRSKAALTPSPGASLTASSLSSGLIVPFVGGSIFGDFYGQKVRIPSLSPSPSGRRGKRGGVTMVISATLAFFVLLLNFLGFSCEPFVDFPD